MRQDVEGFLRAMPEKDASDLHIGADSVMHYRIDNDLVPVNEKVLSTEEANDMTTSLMTQEQKLRFEREKELDFSFSLEGAGRYRANAFFQRGNMGCAIRLIPFKIMSLSECGLPVEVVRGFCHKMRGLILVTGITGSGKSTTLASMVDEINRTRRCHIVTVEDPIEYVHHNKNCIIDQRQLGEDTDSFSKALRHVLRQDPDVILIGELRDLDTIQQALICADTGHLVLGTLHTSDSIQTINRIVDVFPSHQQKQIRTQLSFVLTGILSQHLIPHKDEQGRVLATEVLVANSAVRSLIRDSKEHQVYSVIQTSQRVGMRTINQALTELYKEGKISYEEALARATSVEEIKRLM